MEAVASNRFFLPFFFNRRDEMEAYRRVQIDHAKAGHSGGAALRGMRLLADDLLLLAFKVSRKSYSSICGTCHSTIMPMCRQKMGKPHGSRWGLGRGGEAGLSCLFLWTAVIPILSYVLKLGYRRAASDFIPSYAHWSVMMARATHIYSEWL